MVTAAGPRRPARGGREVSARDRLAERFVELMPLLKQRLTAAAVAEAGAGPECITPHQMQALWYLHRCGPTTMNELARAHGIGLSSATALAARLLRHRLATRRHDPHDRRVVRLAATERAGDLVAGYLEERRRLARAALEPLDDGEAATLVELLERVAGASPAAAR